MRADPYLVAACAEVAAKFGGFGDSTVSVTMETSLVSNS